MCFKNVLVEHFQGELKGEVIKRCFFKKRRPKVRKRILYYLVQKDEQNFLFVWYLQNS